MQRRSGGLGRGLDALIPGEPRENDHVAPLGLTDLAIEQVHPNRYQPRDHFDESSLDALAASVKELGVLQPILVRPDGDGFELIAGERRWRAARRVGLRTIPAIVRTIDDQSSLEHAVVENLHREDLNPLEEAAAYQQLMQEFGLSQPEVATRVGKSRSAVANTLRLFQLSPAVQRYVLDQQITAGHARALLSLDEDGERLKLAERVIEEGLSVRQVEAIVRGDTQVDLRPNEPEVTPAPRGGTGSTKRAGRSTKDAALLELEELLAEQLQTQVDLSMTASRGRITIDFADLDDLERIFRVISS